VLSTTETAASLLTVLISQVVTTAPVWLDSLEMDLIAQVIFVYVNYICNNDRKKANK